MSKKSTLRGYNIEYLDGEWVYSDTKEPTVSNWQSRPCGYCNKHFTDDGHDGCLGELPDVMNACCGHGVVRDTYIQYDTDNIIYGKEANDILSDYIKKAGNNKHIIDRKVENPNSS